MKKILILSANPTNTNKLRLDEEVREIQAGLERARSRGQFEIITKWAVRPDDLRCGQLLAAVKQLVISNAPVAPSNLIKDKGRTPFNIGRAVDLTGFQLSETQPLAQGLVDIGDRQELIKAVLNWTGGQPFLTQKLCKLVLQYGKEIGKRVESNITEWVEHLVRSQMLTNWEALDEPEHLKTIRDRILRSGCEK
ncbi:hypothetical protein [Nostoc sp.]|uniref:hypothetical protein n=1 Tax=Nostoc sp. TaxID=1180 RepID=UPI002FFD0701